MIQTISPQSLERLYREGAPIELLDVRTPLEFRELHVEFSQNLPLDRLDPNAILAKRGDRKDLPLYVICRSGSRGRQACEKLIAAGIANATNVDGGTLACEATGLPIIRGPKAVSLERQVRIVAGSLVFLGAILGYFVHSYWIGLAAFMGGGLVFSGITDTCGLAMILARMPWNQAPTPAQHGQCRAA